MKILITGFLILSMSMIAESQSLYIKAFGDRKFNPVIFLHGGPGYNSANFEASSAQKIADNGFYVIVYDRRGEGRSADKNARFTFAETFDDLESIYQKFGLTDATLIGHSFGGIVATFFAEKYPKKVSRIILAGAPLSLQETFKTIIQKCKGIYATKKDSTNLNYIKLLETMDTSSIEYSAYCLSHAMQNGFYTPAKTTEEVKNIYAAMRKDTLLKYFSQMTYLAPQGFVQHERYTSLDMSLPLKKIINNGALVYGLYGKEDGLYSIEQIHSLQNIIGAGNLIYLDDCSHNVFIDQQGRFMEALKTWVR